MKLLIAIFFFFNLTSISYADISLEDLGMSSVAVPAEQSVKFESEMKERQRKLKTHEVLGLVTLGTMTATLLTGGDGAENNMHMYLGITTGVLYMATAYYSLTAPKPVGVIDRGRIKWHKGLAWIHFPAMILTPILGYMYKKNEEQGKKHGALEEQHSTVAAILYGSFALSAALMVIEF